MSNEANTPSFEPTRVYNPKVVGGVQLFFGFFIGILEIAEILSNGFDKFDWSDVLWIVMCIVAFRTGSKRIHQTKEEYAADLRKFNEEVFELGQPLRTFMDELHRRSQEAEARKRREEELNPTLKTNREDKKDLFLGAVGAIAPAIIGMICFLKVGNPLLSFAPVYGWISFIAAAVFFSPFLTAPKAQKFYDTSWSVSYWIGCFALAGFAVYYGFTNYYSYHSGDIFLMKERPPSETVLIPPGRVLRATYLAGDTLLVWSNSDFWLHILIPEQEAFLDKAFRDAGHSRYADILVSYNSRLKSVKFNDVFKGYTFEIKGQRFRREPFDMSESVGVVFNRTVDEVQVQFWGSANDIFAFGVMRSDFMWDMYGASAFHGLLALFFIATPFYVHHKRKKLPVDLIAVKSEVISGQTQVATMDQYDEKTIRVLLSNVVKEIEETYNNPAKLTGVVTRWYKYFQDENFRKRVESKIQNMGVLRQVLDEMTQYRGSLRGWNLSNLKDQEALSEIVARIAENEARAAEARKKIRDLEKPEPMPEEKQREKTPSERKNDEVKTVSSETVADFRGRMKLRKDILDVLKDEKDSIEALVVAGKYTRAEGDLLIKAAEREAQKKLQTLDQL